MLNELPDGAYLYEVSAYYNQHTIPRNLRVDTPLPPELWGAVMVEDGELNVYVENEPQQPLRATPSTPVIIPEDTRFRVEATGKPVRFYIRYYHEPKIQDADELASQLGGGRQRARAQA